MLLAILVSRGRRRELGRRRPGVLSRLAGAGLLTAGAALALSGGLALGPALRASPIPPDGAPLHTQGVYGLSRHPIYGGLLTAAAGRALATGRRRHRSAALGLGVVLGVKSAYEERLLRQVFAGYDAYAATTPRLLPHMFRKRE